MWQGHSYPILHHRCKPLYNTSAIKFCAWSSNSETNATIFILVGANALPKKYIRALHREGRI